MKVKELIKELLEYDMDMEIGLPLYMGYNRLDYYECDEVSLVIKEDSNENLFVGLE